MRVLDDFSTGKRANLADVESVEVIECDLTRDLLDGHLTGVDVVFHVAAVPSVPRSVEDPLRSHQAAATATLRLLLAAKAAGVTRVINSSSSSVYGNVGSPPMRELMATMPRSPYAVAKLAAEGYTRTFAELFGMETVSLRYFNVFGPRQDPGSPYSAVIPLFITAMLAGRRPTVYGDGHQSRDFTYVANVVEGNLLAADAPGVAGSVFNVASGRSISLVELLAELNDVLGTNVQPVHEPPRPGDIRESLADISAARRSLGYEPRVGFEEGLRLSIGYYRQIAADRNTH